MLPMFLQLFEENVNNESKLLGINSIASLICLEDLVITFRMGNLKSSWKNVHTNHFAFEIPESVIELKLTLAEENKLLQLLSSFKP
jgi:hypothetical protein